MGLPTAPSPFFPIADRLVQLWISNEHELMTLRRLRARRGEVRAYSARADANRRLVEASLGRIDAAIRASESRLGENRRETDGLLARLDQRTTPWTTLPCHSEHPAHRRRRSG